MQDTKIELTFVGHQSWHIAYGDTAILIDPVLRACAGNSDANWRLPVYPPRTVHAEKLPKTTGIIISHEHLDHLDFESLALLDRSIPIITGELMLESVVEAVRGLGFEVIRQAFATPFKMGSFSCVLYPATANDIAYERRVTQVLMWTSSGTGIYNVVDCHLCPQFVADIAAGRVPTPDSIIVTNNSMLPTDGGRDIYYNVGRTAKDSRDGIGALKEVLQPVLSLPSCKYVFLSGNGILPYEGKYGPFLWSDHRELAEFANELSSGPNVFGPYPGDRYHIPRAGSCDAIETDSVDWIDFHFNQMTALQEIDEHKKDGTYSTLPGLPVLTKEYQTAAQAEEGLAAIGLHLPGLSEALLATPFGQSLSVIADPNFARLGPRRFVLRLIDRMQQRTHQFALDINRGTLVPDDTPADLLLESFPHGLEMNLVDFHAILEGRMGVLDLYSAPIRTWFLEDDAREQILSAFAAIYGEQAKPGLAQSVYKGAVDRVLAYSANRKTKETMRQ